MAATVDYFDADVCTRGRNLQETGRIFPYLALRAVENMYLAAFDQRLESRPTLDWNHPCASS